VEILPFTAFGPKDRQQSLMSASPILINQLIEKSILVKSYFVTKKKRRINMVTIALPEDELLPLWSSQLMVSLAKKPLLLRSVSHPVSQQSGNVHTRKFVGLFVRDFRLPLPDLQVAALEETATQPIVSKLQCGIQELAWASTACNPPMGLYGM
jgi:hypothetical protein